MATKVTKVYQSLQSFPMNIYREMYQEIKKNKWSAWISQEDHHWHTHGCCPTSPRFADFTIFASQHLVKVMLGSFTIHQGLGDEALIPIKTIELMIFGFGAIRNARLPWRCQINIRSMMSKCSCEVSLEASNLRQSIPSGYRSGTQSKPWRPSDHGPEKQGIKGDKCSSLDGWKNSDK